jgi:hypothetical protein
MEGIFGSSLVASWVGAIGSAGAAVVAVGVYVADKVSTKRRAREALRASRLATAARVWVYLEPVITSLHELHAKTSTDTKGVLKHHPSILSLPEPHELLNGAGQVGAFSFSELNSMAEAAIAISAINTRVMKSVHRFGDSAYVLSVAIGDDRVLEALNLCTKCYKLMREAIRTGAR